MSPTSRTNRLVCAKPDLATTKSPRYVASTGAGFESLLSVDDAVQRLVGALKATHELQNTVIIYTSDNGYMLGEHRQTRKELAYEESAGVPLLVRGPGFPVGVRRNQVVGNIDLAPTVLDIAAREESPSPYRRRLTAAARTKPRGEDQPGRRNRARPPRGSPFPGCADPALDPYPSARRGAGTLRSRPRSLRASKRRPRATLRGQAPRAHEARSRVAPLRRKELPLTPRRLVTATRPARSPEPLRTAGGWWPRSSAFEPKVRKRVGRARGRCPMRAAGSG